MDDVYDSDALITSDKVSEPNTTNRALMKSLDITASCPLLPDELQITNINTS